MSQIWILILDVTINIEKYQHSILWKYTILLFLYINEK